MAKVIITLEDADEKVDFKMETIEHDGDETTPAMIVAMALYNACMSLENGSGEDDEETN